MQNKKPAIGTIIIGCFAALALVILLILNIMKSGDEKTQQTDTKENVQQTSAQVNETTMDQTEALTQPIQTEATDTGTPAETLAFNYEDSIFTLYPTFENTCENTGTKSIDIMCGDVKHTFTVGVKNDFDRAVILNIACDNVEGRSVIGYYMTCPRGGNILTEQTDPELRPQVIENGKRNGYLIRTFDKIYNMEYEDMVHFGVCWIPEFMATGDQYIDVRAIDLDTHQMLAIFRIMLVQENGKYKIGGLQNLEVEGEVVDVLSALAREAMHNGVVGSLKEGSFDDTRVLVELREYKTYFDSFCASTRHSMIYAGTVQYPVYAVTVHTTVETLSFITFYFNVYVDPSTGTPSYTLTGYDCLAPFTEESIISYDN